MAALMCNKCEFVINSTVTGDRWVLPLISCPCNSIYCKMLIILYCGYWKSMLHPTPKQSYPHPYDYRFQDDYRRILSALAKGVFIYLRKSWHYIVLNLEICITTAIPSGWKNSFSRILKSHYHWLLPQQLPREYLHWF